MRAGLRFLLREPIARYGYIDQIQFWLIDPLDQHTLDLLKSECGKGGLHVSNKRAQFNIRFRQRVQLRQPTENALRLLAQRNDVLINGVEIALDLIFKNWFETERALAFLHQHLIRRWHGSRQQIHLQSEADGVIQYRGGECSSVDCCRHRHRQRLYHLHPIPEQFDNHTNTDGLRPQ
jgi:hypothetical protein